jgi:hypothetical protein
MTTSPPIVSIRRGASFACKVTRRSPTKLNFFRRINGSPHDPFPDGTRRAGGRSHQKGRRLTPFAPRNAILRELEPTTVKLARDRLELVYVRRGVVLQEAGMSIDHVWFPETALVAVASDNVSGAFEACGSRQSLTRSLVQIPGDVWRVRAPVYRELYDASSALRTAVHKHIEALLVETRQLVACTAVHTVENRMSRALLDASDRIHGAAKLQLTQEAMAAILGVQRTTVAVTASALQKMGFIRTTRGAIEILDRAGLEQHCCSCRATIQYAEREIHRSETQVCEA